MGIDMGIDMDVGLDVGLGDVTLEGEYDSLDYLDGEDVIAGYIEEALAGGAAGILDAMDTVWRARLINRIAESTGIDRRALVRALAHGAELGEADLARVLESAKSVAMLAAAGQSGLP
jgi:probable addiction module antidote protein